MSDDDYNAKLLDLAGAVADGTPVDWASIERDVASDEERRVIRHLGAVASIAAVHRSTPEAPGDAAEARTYQPQSLASSDQPDLGVRLERWGHLRIVERVGGGAFGEVYRAFDETLERDVALKLLHPRYTTAQDADSGIGGIIVQEGRNLARLHHPNVVTVHGADVRDGRVGLWMEFVRGRTLEVLLHENGPLGAREATLIGLDLCRALAAVHAAGLSHRDVKAQNVMREEGGRVLLMDFGAGSRLRLPDGGEPGPAGTPLYMAPELLRGGKPTVQSDVYSLGVLLYHLVTGRYPFEGASLAELARAHERPAEKTLRDARPDLPLAFVTAVERALARDPAQRFASAGEMERVLAASLGVNRRWWLVGLVGAGAAAAAIAGWLVLRSALSPEYTVRATLCRVTGAVRSPLAPGDRVRPSDELCLEFEASKPVWVYVVNEDEQGEQWVLFPLAGQDLRNPLEPRGKPYVLPGPRAGTPELWTVTSAGGRERFLVVSSPDANPQFERVLASVPRAEAGRPVRIEGTTRGVGGVQPGQETTRAAPSKVLEAIEELVSEPERVTGTWRRRIELANPPPETDRLPERK